MWNALQAGSAEVVKRREGQEKRREPAFCPFLSVTCGPCAASRSPRRPTATGAQPAPDDMDGAAAAGGAVCEVGKQEGGRADARGESSPAIARARSIGSALQAGLRHQ